MAQALPSMSVLELSNIDKSFGGVHALRGASLSACAGEIHALCGENGAGKSTLLKILSGVYSCQTYDGSVRVQGELRRFETPRDAERAGIAIVHQELMLVPELSVAQNLMLGRELGIGGGIFGLVDDDAMEAHATTQLKRFGIENEIDVLAPAASLGIGLQQVVEIVRALSREASILILDEPTAALTMGESARLMTWLRQLRDAGTTCLYVSHRMDEIFALADRVTVLRDGKTITTLDVAASSMDEVVTAMVGRSVGGKGRRASPRASSNPPPAIELRELSVLLEGGRTEEAEGSRTFAARASFAVARGEVVALAGAMGSGRTALLSALFGSARSGTTGALLLEGQEVVIASPADAVAHGLAFVPEDRKGRGLILGMTVAENLSLPPRRDAKASRGTWGIEWLGLIDEDEEELLAQRRIAELKIRGDAATEVATLSGGNQQKVVIGKWLESPPKVLLLDEPTRGVDIGAREEIYELVDRLTERGTAVIVASSDLAEVIRLAHRVLVLRRGSVAAELDGTTTTEEEIVAIATGAVASTRPQATTSGSARMPLRQDLEHACAR
jgi:D-xylose transport system ATP-binding protein